MNEVKGNVSQDDGVLLLNDEVVSLKDELLSRHSEAERNEAEESFISTKYSAYCRI